MNELLLFTGCQSGLNLVQEDLCSVEDLPSSIGSYWEEMYINGTKCRICTEDKCWDGVVAFWEGDRYVTY